MPAVTPPAARTFRRRDVLVGAGGLALLAVTTATATGCGADEPPKVDDLQSQLDLAESDSELARRAADGAPAPLVTPLTQVSSERAAHARALAEEIARVAGTTVASDTASSTAGTTTMTTAEPGPPPLVTEVIGALKNSAASAEALAVRLSGYRAGLLGSIAASCMSSATVGLDVPGRAS